MARVVLPQALGMTSAAGRNVELSLGVYASAIEAALAYARRLGPEESARLAAQSAQSSSRAKPKPLVSRSKIAKNSPLQQMGVAGLSHAQWRAGNPRTGAFATRGVYKARSPRGGTDRATPSISTVAHPQAAEVSRVVEACGAGDVYDVEVVPVPVVHAVQMDE